MNHDFSILTDAFASLAMLKDLCYLFGSKLPGIGMAGNIFHRNRTMSYIHDCNVKINFHHSLLFVEHIWANRKIYFMKAIENYML